jgi:hypothetical protein
VARKARTKLEKLAERIELGAARTPAARYFRQHFAELAAALPSRVNWTVMRDFLVSEGAIQPGTPVLTVKTAWHREKERAALVRAWDRRQSSVKSPAEEPPSREQRIEALGDALAEAPREKPTVTLRPARPANPSRPPDDDGSQLPKPVPRKGS